MCHRHMHIQNCKLEPQLDPHKHVADDSFAGGSEQLDVLTELGVKLHFPSFHVCTFQAFMFVLRLGASTQSQCPSTAPL